MRWVGTVGTTQRKTAKHAWKFSERVLEEELVPKEVVELGG